MMQLSKPHITTLNHPDFGDMVAVTNGSNNIHYSRYLMSINTHPCDDHETRIYKSTIAFLVEENKWLKKQVKKLTGIYD
ncbi:hypothetical protein [Symbiopectobacterium purcellii]|uniref:Uncharacterized protein n=1 Tax=Symbiopectobacterium purcellii TaxID=2871826 RepID=A0ABX9ANI2_9ENTR|nr:hypothetical protein [Symbiopectobacterium purcellii]QZN96356.1 hypothetical protein K6K13_02475 [Symbiopectobacterium purcellii]